MSVFDLKKYPIWLLLALLTVGISFGETHKVQKSETFYSIAAKHGVSVDALMAANGMKDARSLQLGKVLTIPSKTYKVATKASSPVSSKAKVMSRSLQVIIDPGHGGNDKGAVWGGVRESDLNLKVAMKAEYYLKAKGYSVTLTRRSDTYVSLSRRAQISNQYRNAVFVSIHFNASKYTSVRGAETFYAGTKGRYLAQSIQRELASKLNVRNRGIRFRNYSVLRQTACPAVLVECGFISNVSERARCNTSSYQSSAAQAIVAGIEKYDRSY